MTDDSRAKLVLALDTATPSVVVGVVSVIDPSAPSSVVEPVRNEVTSRVETTPQSGGHSREGVVSTRAPSSPGSTSEYRLNQRIGDGHSQQVTPGW